MPLRKRLATILALAAALIAPNTAFAVDPFEFQVYGAGTNGLGAIVPQLLTNYVMKSADPLPESGYSSAHMVRTAIEIEFGIARSIDFAAYVNFALPSGDAPQYAGAKGRFHGSLAKPGEWPVDVGWYAEIESWDERFDDDVLELELMPTLQKTWGNFSVILDAPDIDKVLVGPGKDHWFEVGYRSELRYRLSRDIHVGFQAFGGIGAIDAPDSPSEQEHYLAPVVHVLVPGNIRATFGFLFGITGASDPLLYKTNLTFNGHEALWD